MSLQELSDRYLQLAHAMQTGVMYMLDIDTREAGSKDLRVGVNSAMVNQAAIVDLLIEKGVINREEYYEKMNKWMTAEVERYEETLSKHYQRKIKLL